MVKKSFLITYIFFKGKIVNIGDFSYTGSDLLTYNGIEYIKDVIKEQYKMSDNENVTILNIIELH